MILHQCLEIWANYLETALQRLCSERAHGSTAGRARSVASYENL
jgi:hypothetical protein